MQASSVLHSSRDFSTRLEVRTCSRIGPIVQAPYAHRTTVDIILVLFFDVVSVLLWWNHGPDHCRVQICDKLAERLASRFTGVVGYIVLWFGPNRRVARKPRGPTMPWLSINQVQSCPALGLWHKCRCAGLALLGASAQFGQAPVAGRPRDVDGAALEDVLLDGPRCPCT